MAMRQLATRFVTILPCTLIVTGCGDATYDSTHVFRVEGKEWALQVPKVYRRLAIGQNGAGGQLFAGQYYFDRKIQDGSLIEARRPRSPLRPDYETLYLAVRNAKFPFTTLAGAAHRR
jgi:hypothetical protein